MNAPCLDDSTSINDGVENIENISASDSAYGSVGPMLQNIFFQLCGNDRRRSVFGLIACHPFREHATKVRSANT